MLISNCVIVLHMSEGDHFYESKVREAPLKYNASPSSTPEIQAQKIDVEPYQPELVRTQVMLTKAQRAYLKEEATRTNRSMSEQLRHHLDEMMNPKQTDWTVNPLMEETVVDEAFEAPSNASENLDTSVYGSYEG